MPKVHLNRTAGARRGMTYVGISQRSNSEGDERREKRARRQKKTIVRDAKLLARSEDWRDAGEQFAVLHRRWKAAGSAGRAYDEKLWQSFKAAADRFHGRRAKHFAEVARLAKARAAAAAAERHERQSEYVQRWLAEDTERLSRAMVGQDEVSVTEFYERLTGTDA